MKFLFSLFIIVTITKECNKNNDSMPTNPVDDIEEFSETNQLQENITFEYSAISRGFYNKVTITSLAILIKKDRNSKAISKACSKDDWFELMSLINTINLKTISNLEAPTEARFYDGAAIAQLIITQENTSFETNSFDHGKPPVEIETLVKKILSLSENIE